MIILLIYYYCFPLSLSPCLPPVPPCLRNARPYKAKAGVRVNITRRDGRAIPVAPRAQVVGVVSALVLFDPATGCHHFFTVTSDGAFHPAIPVCPGSPGPPTGTAACSLMFCRFLFCRP